MNSRSNDQRDVLGVDGVTNHRRVPAWLLSVVLHAVLAIVFAFAFRAASRGGPPESGRPVGVALVKQTDLNREYIFSDQKSVQAEQEATSAASVASAIQSAASVNIDLSDVLPSSDVALFSTGDIKTGESTDIDAASNLLPGTIGQTTTSVFGVSGTGSTFVYVFDRSASMKGRPLEAAKQQLSNSLAALGDVHQFQIIFYNEKPKYYQAGGRTARLVFADEGGKRSGISFVDSITAVGATRHMPAITMAMGMRPDVIFFLTDADEPQLTEFELKKIRQLNRGTTINAIQFGAGPQSASDNFLLRLARQNGGQHAYVDVTLLQSQ